MDLSQYRLQPIHQDGEFILYRGLRQTKTDTSPPSILVLSPVMERPAPATLKKIEHEFSLKDELNPASAIRPIALTEQQSRTMLVFEDPDGEPLDGFLRRPMELKEFLHCGIALAAALGQVHTRGLVHKDIKPSNVLTNAALDRAWLKGFGIASRLPRERQRAEPPEFISGTLAYMAPEQTGRMNRSIDSRSDLYAFGITLYELLTGSLPFTASDPMEWVHCHIARQPPAPAERRRDVPRSVSAIIMKLLAKAPEERYQTAAGVESDFRRCLEDWDRERDIHDFALGEHDRRDRLQIPENLYGREREIEKLLESFERVVKSGTPELVLVSGYSGIGKSSVVNELHKVLVPSRSLFASGKCDQFKCDIPYGTLAYALQTLIRRVLSKPETELRKWRDDLREALEPNGALVVGLVPELKFIIGEQPTVRDVPAHAAKVRFQLAVRRLIGVFARPDHPLVLFLDDLQWLDTATLDLLEDVLGQAELQHLLIIGAYRDTNVDEARPLVPKLAAIRKTGSLVQEIVLAPLKDDDLAHLIADALRCEPQHAMPLARLVHEKTGGNPFFANQFIQELVDEHLVTFDPDRAEWGWDPGSIRAKGFTDNVVELMVGKLSRLPHSTQDALKDLACLGSSAEASMLAIVRGTSKEELHADLWEALRLELIVHSENWYRFVHDRVQEAAYSLIPEEQRAPAHLRIGKLLTTHIAPDKREDAIFEFVGHLNRGSAIIASEDDREELAALNLVAGKRARTATAYGSALNYLITGAALLPEDGWERRHDLVFELEFQRAACEFLTGKVTSAEERLVTLSHRATNAVERGAVACLLADIHFARQRPHLGLTACLECLRHVGLAFPMSPTDAQAQASYNHILSKLERLSIDELANVPTMSDPAAGATLDVLAKVIPSALSMDKNLLSLIVCAAVDLSLEHGHCDSSCFAYEYFGFVAGGLFGNIEVGFRFRRLGYEVLERKRLRQFEAAVHLIFANQAPWAKHGGTSGQLIRGAFALAIKTGDPLAAAASCSILVWYMLVAGEPLVEAEKEAQAALEVHRRQGFAALIDAAAAQVAYIRHLRGFTRQFGLLDDDEFDERRLESFFSTQPHLPVLECEYWIRKLQARFMAGDYIAALDASIRAQRLLWATPVLIDRAEYEFYSSLAHAAVCNSHPADERRAHLLALAAHGRWLEACARECPENFEDRAALAAAEVARIEDRDSDAMRLYERAIRSARANDFVQNEALANELAARFYAARGFETISRAYLRNARYGYLRWGADGKVRQLDQLHPRLWQEERAPGPTGTIEAPVEQLDLATVIKVSQAVSGEMVLERLIDRLMRAAIEQAGAERGLLVCPQNEELQIDAEATARGEEIAVQVRERDARIAVALPESLIRYVIRTRETVILDDASSQNPFSADPYVVQRRARSILCLPLINQGQLIGILYLENNLTPHLFPPDRVTVLKVLASQAAISLGNTGLYRDLKASEAELRRAHTHLTEAQRLSQTGSFTWDVQEDNHTWSAETYRIFGFEPGSKVTMPMIQAVIHPEDMPAVEAVIGGAVEGADFELVFRIVTPSGALKHAHVVGHRSQKITDRPVFVGAVQDVTESKIAEAEIRALKDQLYRENLALRDEVDRASMFEEIIGSSQTLKTVLSRIARVAPTDSTVFISGETGTGKELIARAVHKRSQRSGRAFVSVNCAALAPTLIPSELFGHEKGAFTGATQRRLGRFELADGGTIFLDEVGELLPDTQVALLRVLQEREFERVGGTQPIHVDVRVIAATNRDLKAAIANGSFRQDLFYRLNVFPIQVPPLRERKDDLLMLVEYFVQRYASRAGKNLRSIDKKTLELLQAYDWPGNIRELQNVIERSVILSSGGVFAVDELWLSTQSSQPTPRVATAAPFEGDPRSEQEIIEAALAESRGRVAGPSGAAARLNIPASTLEYKIKSLKIRKSQFKFGGSARENR